MLAERLELQGFKVVQCSDGAEGAVLALEDPPAAVIADLTMPSISGVQLCRLLGSEIGTSKVPVILRGDEGGSSRFWAEQAGAFAYVPKGRMGELMRALRKAIDAHRTTAISSSCRRRRGSTCVSALLSTSMRRCWTR